MNGFSSNIDVTNSNSIETKKSTATLINSHPAHRIPKQSRRKNTQRNETSNIFRRLDLHFPLFPAHYAECRVDVEPHTPLYAAPVYAFIRVCVYAEADSVNRAPVIWPFDAPQNYPSTFFPPFYLNYDAWM